MDRMSKTLHRAGILIFDLYVALSYSSLTNMAAPSSSAKAGRRGTDRPSQVNASPIMDVARACLPEHSALRGDALRCLVTIQGYKVESQAFKALFEMLCQGPGDVSLG